MVATKSEKGKPGNVAAPVGVGEVDAEVHALAQRFVKGMKGELLSRTKKGIRYEPSLPYFKIAFDWGLI